MTALLESIAVFVSGTAGLLTGGLGAVLSNWLKERHLASQREHEYRMAQLQGDNAKWSTVQAINQRRDDNRTTEYVAAMGWSPYVENVSKYVVSLRSLFRPALTVVLLTVTVWLIRDLIHEARLDNSALAMAFNADNAIGQLVREGFHNLVYMTNTATGFWFVGREIKQVHEK